MRIEAEFLNGDRYRTLENDGAFKKRTSSLISTFRFYPRILSETWRASRYMSKNPFDDKKLFHYCETLFRALEKLNIHFEIEGIDHIRGLNGPVVFISNHMSTLETIIIPLVILPFTRFSYVAKESLSRLPVFKKIVLARKPILVTLKDHFKDIVIVMKEGVKRLEEGVSVVIFPEAKRYPAFDSKKFRPIGLHLAKRAHVPVIPIAVKTDAWSIGKVVRLKEFGTLHPEKEVHIEFGSPREISKNIMKDHDDIVHFIQERLLQWKEASKEKDCIE
ncbi:lysophospholipid acyltransferase family protein [Chlamydiota bacterium]